jgi:hypothetical protein
MKVAIQLFEQVDVTCQLSDEAGVHEWAARQGLTLLKRDARHDGPGGLYRVHMTWQRPVGSPQKHGFLPADISGLLDSRSQSTVHR